MNLTQILMTSNVLTNNILTFISAFLEAFLYEKLFTQILKIESTKKQSLIYVISFGLIAFCTNLFLTNPMPYIINLATFFMLVHFIFKQNIRNSFVAIISSYILIFISSILAQTIFDEIFNIHFTDLINIPIYKLLTYVLIYTIFFLIYLLIKKRNLIIDYIKPSLKSTIIINLILGIMVIFINAYIFSFHKFELPLEVKLVTITSLILYFIISMYSLIRTNKLEQATQDLETEKMYNKTLQLLHDNMRCFKHDFNNIVQVIGGYISLNDMEGLKRYYSNLLKECKLTNNLNLLNPESINNPSIYSLLNNKFYKAYERGITMNFDIFTDLTKINFNIFEFTRILGILLDNAIEAAAETDEKLVEITFKSDNKKQLFIIENSCADNNISTTKIFEKGFSTKKNNSGIGLWKVHKILEKNTNIDLFTTVKNHKFSQQLAVFFN